MLCINDVRKRRRRLRGSRKESNRCKRKGIQKCGDLFVRGNNRVQNRENCHQNLRWRLVEFEPEARKSMALIQKLGFANLPICMAKTPLSLSDNPKKSADRGFTCTVKKLEIAGGAGYIIAHLGDIVSMPGLPSRPAAENIQLDDRGNISGLFLEPCHRSRDYDAMWMICRKNLQSAQQNSMISQELSSSQLRFGNRARNELFELENLNVSSSAKKYSRAQKREKNSI